MQLAEHYALGRRMGRAARQKMLLGALVVCLSSCGGRREHADHFPLPFKTAGDYLAAWDGQDYRSLFVKGINLGVGLPGTQPGELAPTEAEYADWFARMDQLGLRVIRIYTLHYPRFYRALATFNSAHPDRPLYVLHGIWLDEVEVSGTMDLFEAAGDFDAAIDEVVDAVHGNRTIPLRYGRAFGEYDIDTSEWVLGWVIGREILPGEVEITDQAYPERRSYHGTSLKLATGTPSEVWAAARLDHLIAYERHHYRVERPVSLSSWPTLDPLTHFSESLPEASHEDSSSIDLSQLETQGAPGGVFATFHAYPYYPNFINNEPRYRESSDDRGPNSYLGYLRYLKQHYSDMPLLIGEFGVPSSWGNAHYGHSGLHHGGHDEQTQGEHNARQIRNIYETRCAGGALFSWFDEWWKRTWIVDERSMPRDRYRLWPDATSPEQNFGLIAFETAPPDYSVWPKLAGSGRIVSVEAAASAGFFHLRIGLEAALQTGDTLTVGLDTYADDRGESILPGAVQSQRRHEFAVTVSAPTTAQLFVTETYDLYGIWHGLSTDRQQYRSTASDGAPWVPVVWVNSGEHRNRDGSQTFPMTEYEIGRLRIRNSGQAASSMDAVVVEGNWVEIRLPWTLLNFADPSTLSVIDDDRASAGRETTTTAGIAVSVALGDDLLESGRYRWQPWDEAPAYTAREKPSATTYANALRAIPDLP